MSAYGRKIMHQSLCKDCTVKVKKVMFCSLPIVNSKEDIKDITRALQDYQRNSENFRTMFAWVSNRTNVGYDYVGLSDLKSGTRVKNALKWSGIEFQLTFISKVILDCAINSFFFNFSDGEYAVFAFKEDGRSHLYSNYGDFPINVLCQRPEPAAGSEE